MTENYVTLSLETYNELHEKAKNFDELKEKLGNDLEKALKDSINGLHQFIENMNRDCEENQEMDSCQEKK